jgi:hypothetical protein
MYAFRLGMERRATNVQKWTSASIRKTREIVVVGHELVSGLQRG